MQIDLDLDCINAPVKLHQAKIEASMLWPNDPLARDRWFRAARLEEHKDEFAELPDSLKCKLFQDALNMPRLPELMPEAVKHKDYGTIAGLVVMEALCNPGRLTLEQIRKRLVDRMKGTFQIERQTMVNTDGHVQRFRPVAHLWASYAFMISTVENYRPFPCRMNEIPAFLARAELFRRHAEKTRMPRSPSTIMRPGDAHSLPPAIVAALPKVSITIGDLTITGEAA